MKKVDQEPVKVPRPWFVTFDADPEGNGIAQSANQVVANKLLSDEHFAKKAAETCRCSTCKGRAEDAEKAMDWGTLSEDDYNLLYGRRNDCTDLVPLRKKRRH